MKRRHLLLVLPLVLGCAGAALLMAQAAPRQPGVAAAAGAPAMPGPRPVLLTGQVEADDSQSIIVPPSDSSPVVLRTFVADGSVVKKGDVLLRIDSPNAQNLNQLDSELAQNRARAELDGANLEVAAIEAEKALANAKAALAKGRVDAALPKAQISALDFDRYQGERERAERDLEVKEKAFASATEAVQRRRDDAELETKKLLLNMAFSKATLAQSEVRAARDGVVVHGFSEWRGERYDEGASAFPGSSAGVVMGSGGLSVRAWALEADRPFVREGQAVRLGFDALPGLRAQGLVRTIASAPAARASWGGGRYFELRIALPADMRAPLVPGMSVLVETSAGSAAAAATEALAPADLTLEGEIAAKVATPVAPPTIAQVWQYTLAQLAPEGSLVRPGQPIAIFSAPDVQSQIDNKGSALKEKQRALDKLRLDQAEADRAGDLAVSEAQSNAEKAARKATQPKELIRRVDYDKLVVERALHAQLAALALRQRAAQGRARQAEMSGLNAEIARLKVELAALVQGQTALTVAAPRAGLVLHRLQFSGEKFSVGSQVWMGSSVATLADPDQLIVNAKVPEVQAAQVRVGQAARVEVQGANLSLSAHVSALGRTFHSKSRSQPIIVRDVELQFDSPPKGLKPGAAVQVALGDAAHAAPAKNKELAR
ncbi:MAG: HlyD family efflux transporter periplasmic adaptor subunit [Pseudomonadota bacterium]